MAGKQFKAVIDELFTTKEEAVQEKPANEERQEEGKKKLGRPSIPLERKIAFQKITLNLDKELMEYIAWASHFYKTRASQYIRSILANEMRASTDYAEYLKEEKKTE